MKNSNIGNKNNQEKATTNSILFGRTLLCPNKKSKLQRLLIFLIVVWAVIVNVLCIFYLSLPSHDNNSSSSSRSNNKNQNYNHSSHHHDIHSTVTRFHQQQKQKPKDDDDRSKKNDESRNDNNHHRVDEDDPDNDKVKNIFLEAGIELLSEDRFRDQLPTWKHIVREFGEGPKIYGLDSCERYRDAIPAVERNIGCCGMFNSGTNLVTKLLKENCKIPERVARYGWNRTFENWGIGPGEAHGIRWQVPWGKHTHAKYRDQHSTKKATDIDKASLLPIVTIRHPLGWMKSMCFNSYTAKWKHNQRNLCPNLMTVNKEPIPVEVSYGEHFRDTYESLAHVWNGWYEGYYDSTEFPFLMVRFEDLIFHTKEVTTRICQCAGGEIRTDRPFFHIVASAKDGPGHGKKEQRTGMEQAWIKYQSQPNGSDFRKHDLHAAQQYLNKNLMETFGYRMMG